jgi:hypothetical protein
MTERLVQPPHADLYTADIACLLATRSGSSFVIRFSTKTVHLFPLSTHLPTLGNKLCRTRALH